jgi:hypothetical protein
MADQLSVQGGHMPKLHLNMGKKGEEVTTPEGSSAAEMELLKNKVALMEEAF